METPQYKVTNWATDGQKMTYDDGSVASDLDLFIYHTPGHTPDELAIWDPRERFIFVGDTMYERAPIIFPLEGNLQDYTSTLFKLRDLIKTWNGGAAAGARVKMACGHVTSAVDAEDFVQDVEGFLSKVRRGLVEPQDRGKVRGIPLVGYTSQGGRLSFLGPKQLFDNFRVDRCPV